jgi:hypothetical protein
VPAVARYQREWIIRELSTKARDLHRAPFDIPDGLRGLFLVDAGVALRELVRVLESGESWNWWRMRLPVTVPRSSVPDALTALELMLRWEGPHAWRKRDALPFVLLQAVAAVADDAASVRRLYDLLPANPGTPSHYDALFEVGHRAKVRVMPDGRLIELSG